MKKLILYIFASITIIAVPRVFAQNDSNSDFNPFPQMEQDQQNIDSDTALKPEQNDDVWPPANSDTQSNSGDNQ